MKFKILPAILLLTLLSVSAQELHYVFKDITPKDIRVGADRVEVYLTHLKNKKVAVCANHTSLIGNTHLVDSLISMNVNVVKIFCPEHGFRGEGEAGEKIKSSIDKKTGLPIVSLYGTHRKPDSNDLDGVNLIIFDIQDVGARFYTYISTLQYIMEAAAERNITVMVLDRPNPNGYWVDGPVLKKEYTSFVGMAPIPVVHGMTVGEYAKMINGEKWLNSEKSCLLQVVPVQGYHHTFRYQLPVSPSPNLNSMTAIYLYPTLCFFEGTPVSIGRGTDKPFRIVGYPNSSIGDYTFTPKDIRGIATNVPNKNKKCTGFDLSTLGDMVMKNNNFVNIDLIMEMYNHYPDKHTFFTPFFDKLAGTDQLRKQIIEGKSAEEIRASWQDDIIAFKKIRKKYLLYGDFE